MPKNPRFDGQRGPDVREVKHPDQSCFAIGHFAAGFWRNNLNACPGRKVEGARCEARGAEVNAPECRKPANSIRSMPYSQIIFCSGMSSRSLISACSFRFWQGPGTTFVARPFPARTIRMATRKPFPFCRIAPADERN
jgi:hypothetical protein